jgi:hypothetical protein
MEIGQLQMFQIWRSTNFRADTQYDGVIRDYLTLGCEILGLTPWRNGGVSGKDLMSTFISVVCRERN